MQSQFFNPVLRKTKSRRLLDRKYVDNLMFRSEKSNWTFRLQNNTVNKLQSAQFSTIFKLELCGKVNKYLLCLHKNELQNKFH